MNNSSLLAADRATHLKIADSSWHNTQSLTPLLPALRVLGRVSIDVLEVAGPG